MSYLGIFFYLSNTTLFKFIVNVNSIEHLNYLVKVCLYSENWKIIEKSDNLWVYANEVYLKTVYLLLFNFIFHVTLLIKWITIQKIINYTWQNNQIGNSNIKLLLSAAMLDLCKLAYFRNWNFGGFLRYHSRDLMEMHCGKINSVAILFIWNPIFTGQS